MREPRSCFGFYYRYPERYIYVVGGEIAPNLQTGGCERFDVYNKKWSSLPFLPERISNAGVCCYGGRSLYVFGGFFGNYPNY